MGSRENFPELRGQRSKAVQHRISNSEIILTFNKSQRADEQVKIIEMLHFDSNPYQEATSTLI